MAGFDDVRSFEAFHSEQERFSTQNNVADVQSSGVYPEDDHTNIQCQPGTPELDSFWPHGPMHNDIPAHMIPLDQTYLLPAAVSSDFSFGWAPTNVNYPYSPPNSTESFVSYQTGHSVSSSHRRSQSFDSPLGSSQQLSPPTTPNQIYGTISTEGSTVSFFPSIMVLVLNKTVAQPR